MGKRKAGFNMKGELSILNGRFVITTIENKGKENEKAVTYDLSNELINFLEHTITVNVSEDVMIEPIDDNSIL